VNAVLSTDRSSASSLLAGLAAAEQAFMRRFPSFDPDGSFAAIRRCEYGRLDAAEHMYLDYAGGSLYAASQVEAHAQLLRRGVFGNPHSNNPTSLAATALVTDTRKAVLEFFDASSDEYYCVFTANASGALKLVGESYPFTPGSVFALTADNHNSVNGIREFARRKGAAIAYVPVVAPELRVDRAALTDVLNASDSSRSNLLAFPAQSNFSGVQHPLDIIDEAHDRGWEVLLDAAAFAPTNRLNVSLIRPDFVAASFYKIVGYPTGVGCLLVRRDRMRALVRPWFAGGTVTIASVRGDGHYLRPDEGGFEDGTVDYLNLPAVSAGLRLVEELGIVKIHERVSCLTRWLLDAMTALHHGNGRPVVTIYGPTSSNQRGGTVAFAISDRDGRVVCERHVEALANRANISLRTGCFCNPGANETAHDLRPDELGAWFGRAQPVWPDELHDGLIRQRDGAVSAIRASLGIASNFADVYRFACFLQSFVDRTADEIAAVAQPVAAGPHSL
jgi:molybdenum cofactor sulfurtransferase